VNELRPDNFCSFAGLPTSLTDSMNDAQQALYDLENFYQNEFVDLKNDLFLNVSLSIVLKPLLFYVMSMEKGQNLIYLCICISVVCPKIMYTGGGSGTTN
jgi:hypothetical protein